MSGTLTQLSAKCIVECELPRPVHAVAVPRVIGGGGGASLEKSNTYTQFTMNVYGIRVPDFPAGGLYCAGLVPKACDIATVF